MSKNPEPKTATETTYETLRHFRKDWGAISPVPHIIPNKKRTPSEKHKKDYTREEDE